MTDIYEIRVQERLDDGWANRFDDFCITHEDDGTTLLVGSVRDQAALHGLLAKVRDLGLTLLSVIRTEPEQRPDRYRGQAGHLHAAHGADRQIPRGRWENGQ
jgi:hypothetical protein